MSTTTVKLTPELGDATLTQEWLEEARETGETDTHSRRYRDPRTTWSVPLDIHICLDGRRSETCYATSCDVSSGGIGFRTREAIPPYTRIVICRAGEMVGVPARTLANTETLTGYIVGAEFLSEDKSQALEVVAKAG